MPSPSILPDDEPSYFPSEPTMRGRTTPRGERLRAGDVLLGRYTVLSELGEGGMGVVYKCLDKVGGIEVALKCLPPELSRNEAEMEGIRENYAIVAKLHHSAISGLRNLERDPGFGEYYLVMDLAEGEDLSAILRRRHGAPMPPEEALAILRPLAAALDYAHARKVLHRDVKPANVKVSFPESGGAPLVQLLDFGLAAEVRSSMSRVSVRGHVGTSGTPSYMAPEQWEARRQTPATDQYAFAVVAYQMLSGTLPFEADDPDILRRAVLSRDPDPVPGLSRAANAALLRALAKDPVARFPSCTAFVEEVGRTLRVGRGCTALTPRPVRRHAGLFAAAFSLLVVAGLGAVLLALGRARSPGVPLESHVEFAESAEPGGMVRSPSEPVESHAEFAESAEPGGASRPGEPPSSPSSPLSPPSSPFPSSPARSERAPSLPPEGAPRAELADAPAQPEARRDALDGQGYPSSDPERAPVEEVIAALEREPGNLGAGALEKKVDSELREIAVDKAATERKTRAETVKWRVRDQGSAKEESLVSQSLSDPEVTPWEEGKLPTTTGEFCPLDERPDDPDAPKDHKALRLIVRYGAYSFGGWSASPKARTLPGKVVKITGWSRKGNEDSWGMGMNFVDANTNKFLLAIPAKSTAWERFECEIPETVQGKDPETGKNVQLPIKFPIKIDSISQHNWADRNNPVAKERILDIYDLRVHTDMSQIPVKNRPYEIGVTFPTVANCFYYGEEDPVVVLSVFSWLGEERTIRMTAEVESATGEKRPMLIPDVKVLDDAFIRAPLPFTEPGSYKLRVKCVGFSKDFKCEHRYAVILHPSALTERQKDDSPYGINVHGGAYVGYEKFSKLGFAWVRDYAFNYNWMVRARGDGKYAGWPWYPKIVRAAEEQGLRTLPCLMTAAPCREEDPAIPTKEWRQNIAHIVSTFSQLAAFELDNESGDPMSDKYGEYHRVFAEIMKACRPDALSVQEGCGGIHLLGAKKHVLNGNFRDLKVLNGHRYAGMVGPEVSRSNFNTVDIAADEAKIYQRDLWRQWKINSELDGVKRQRWITEWGWDTRAGQIVSEWEQAAYMQREWVLALGNGIDKLFWYWFYDSDTPNPMNFFDGCGIFDRFRDPKPVAPAFAALRTFLPADMEYLGYANFGPNHMAHMLRRADGKLVACAFQLYPNEKATMMKPEDRELVIKDPKCEKVYDMFGAELKRSDKRKLDIAPTWYIGLDPGCEWLKQCPIDFCFESPFFVRNVSGEPIPLHLLNFGKDGISYRVELPKKMVDSGWKVEERDYGFDVVGPLGAPREASQFAVIGTNQGVEKKLLVDLDIITQAYAKSNVEQFDRTFKVNVVNQSATNQVYELRANLPEGWEVSPASQRTKELEPNGIDTLTFTLVKSSAIPATEKVAIPKLEIFNVSNPAMEGMVIDYAPVIPRAWTLRRVAKGQIKIDGQPGEWAKDAAKYQLPNWMLGPRGDKETSRIYMAYDDDGVYMMFDLDDSQCKTSDPNSFWRAADCLEFQFGSNGDFSEGKEWSVDDHQFWFCPMPLENRVFSGFWPNCKDQKSPVTDNKVGITPEQGITSALSIVKDKAGDVTGYRMEIFISKDRIHGWNPKKGNFVKMMFTIAVQGLRDPREVYWPSPKRGDMATKKPWTWSRVRLGD